MPPDVPCSRDPLVVNVFLDSLEGVSAEPPRLVSFQLRIAFDPAVVEAEGATLGPALGANGEVVGGWALGGPAIDNATGSIFFGGVALVTSEADVEAAAVRPPQAGAPVLLAEVRLRTVGAGSAALTADKLTLTGPNRGHFEAKVGIDALAVREGDCAAFLPTPTPYVPPPTVTPAPQPRPESRGPLPPGLPPAPPGCEWVVSNPEPPIMAILRYCGNEQTTWGYDTRTGEYFQTETWTGSDVKRCDGPCPTAEPLAVPPVAAPGCSWQFANRESGWIDGDATPPPAPWDVYVEVCGDIPSGRAFDPATGEMFNFGRTAPVGSR